MAAMEWTGTSVTWKPLPQPAKPPQPTGPNTFDRITTTGAVRVTIEAGSTLITPLPGGNAFDIRIHQDLPPRTIEALNESQAVVAKSPARVENGVTIITRDPAIFAYRLTP